MKTKLYIYALFDLHPDYFLLLLVSTMKETDIMMLQQYNLPFQISQTTVSSAYNSSSVDKSDQNK
jgi:hypothetical protein